MEHVSTARRSPDPSASRTRRIRWNASEPDRTHSPVVIAAPRAACELAATLLQQGTETCWPPPHHTNATSRQPPRTLSSATRNPHFPTTPTLLPRFRFLGPPPPRRAHIPQMQPPPAEMHPAVAVEASASTAQADTTASAAAAAVPAPDPSPPPPAPAAETVDPPPPPPAPAPKTVTWSEKLTSDSPTHVHAAAAAESSQYVSRGPASSSSKGKRPR